MIHQDIVHNLLWKLRLNVHNSIMKIWLHRVADSYIAGAIKYINVSPQELDDKEYLAELRDRFWGEI